MNELYQYSSVDFVWADKIQSTVVSLSWTESSLTALYQLIESCADCCYGRAGASILDLEVLDSTSALPMFHMRWLTASDLCSL